MAEVRNDNPYTIVVVHDKKSRSFEDFDKEFKRLEVEKDDILYYKSCPENKESGKDQAYIACVKKYINDNYSKNKEYQGESGIHITRLHPKNDPKGKFMSWSFFIKTDKIHSSSVINLLNFFETKNFIKKGSYQVLAPVPYPDGTERNYLIVTFEKNEGSIPKKFIRKLKILLNNSNIDGQILKVNWAQNYVVKDVLEGEKKEQSKRSKIKK
jgi:hypothetical protein